MNGYCCIPFANTFSPSTDHVGVVSPSLVTPKRKDSFPWTQNQRGFSVETSLNSSCRASAFNEGAMKYLHLLVCEYLGVELSSTKRECLQLSKQSSEKYANIFTVQEQMWLKLLTRSKGTRSNADFPYQFFQMSFPIKARMVLGRGIQHKSYERHNWSGNRSWCNVFQLVTILPHE